MLSSKLSNFSSLLLAICLFKMSKANLLDALHELISNSSFILKINKEDLLRWNKRGIEWSLASIREHASSAIIFARTSTDQICVAGSEPFNEHFSKPDGEQRAPHKFSSRRNLSFISRKRCFVPRIVVDTSNKTRKRKHIYTNIQSACIFL